MGKKKNKNNKKKRKNEKIKIINNNNKDIHITDNLNKKEDIKYLTEMCSKEEMFERQNDNLLSIFEINNNEEKIYIPEKKLFINKVNPLYAIKSYIRPNSEKKDNLIRTPKILLKTLNFILNNIIDSDIISNSNFPNVNFSDIYLFCEDRFKSIKQDFIILKNDNSIEFFYCLETIIRFEILSLNQTLNYSSINGIQGLYKLLIKQIYSNLICLINAYKKSDISKNKDEFYSYFLLISIKQSALEFYNSISIIPKKYRKKKNVKLSLEICYLINNKNWNEFFKKIKSNECSYLLSCLMMIFITEMRLNCLFELGSGLIPKQTQYQTTLKKLCNILLFDSIKEFKLFIENIGLIIDPNVNNSNEVISLYLNKDFDIDFNLLNVKMNIKVVEKKRKSQLRKNIIVGNLIYDDNKNINLTLKKFIKGILIKNNFIQESPLLISISFILIIKLISKYCIERNINRYKNIINCKIPKVKFSDERIMAYKILKYFIKKIDKYIFIEENISFSFNYISNLLQRIIENENLNINNLLKFIQIEFNKYIEKIRNIRIKFLPQNKNKKQLLNKKRQRK